MVVHIVTPTRLRVVGVSGSGKSHLAAFVVPAPHPGARRTVEGMAADRADGLSFANETDASRYTLRKGEQIVSVLDYRDDGRTVAMTRAYTVPTFRGHGYAAEIVARAVAEVEAAGDRAISPVCWYVADWFAAHPERAGLLAERRTG